MFCYSKEMAERVYNAIAELHLWNGAGLYWYGVDNEFPLESAESSVRFSPDTFTKALNIKELNFQSFLDAHGSANVFYYTLMHTRSDHPAFFPVHDICFLATNLLARQQRQWQEQRVGMSSSNVMRLILLDWELLPIAVLATTFGVQITLPPCTKEAESAQALRHSLMYYLPEGQWDVWQRAVPHLAHTHAEASGNLFLLGKNPLSISEGLFETSRVDGGIFLTHWDFLNLRIYTHARQEWLKSGLVESVLQLPRPRRQRVSVHPAFMVLKRRKSDTVRMAHMEQCNAGPGGLDMQQTLASLDAGSDIAAQDILQSASCSLLPAVHMAKNNAPHVENIVPLREIAHVLRCQIPRTLFDHKQWMDYYHACMPFHMDDDRDDDLQVTIYTELGLADIDTASGFVDMLGGQEIEMTFSSMGKQGKYLLQEGDIVMIFRGSEESIGKVGYVDELPDALEEKALAHRSAYGIKVGGSIAGKSMFIIRTFAPSVVDAVWLFAYLRHGSVRAHLAEYAKGSGVLTITTEQVKNLPIAVPSADNVRHIHDIHREISDSMNKIRQIYVKIHHNAGTLGNIMKKEDS